jgi:hypothetical protein
MSDQRKSSKFEAFLFGVTRALAILGAAAGFVALALAVQSFLEPLDDTHVGLGEINAEVVSETGTVADARAESASMISRLPILEEYLAGDNKEILDGWLDGLSDPEQQQDFVDNLAEVIEGAEQKDLDVIKVINNYKTIKLSKLKQSDFERYAKVARRGALLGAMLGIVLFISLMSLVLVMLAIERNTRVNRT